MEKLNVFVMVFLGNIYYTQNIPIHLIVYGEKNTLERTNKASFLCKPNYVFYLSIEVLTWYPHMPSWTLFVYHTLHLSRKVLSHLNTNISLTRSQSFVWRKEIALFGECAIKRNIFPQYSSYLVLASLYFLITLKALL